MSKIGLQIKLAIAGVVLIAVACWGWRAMSNYQRHVYFETQLDSMLDELERVGGDVRPGPKGSTLHLEAAQIDMNWISTHLAEDAYNGVKEIRLAKKFDNDTVKQLIAETPRLENKIAFVNATRKRNRAR